ncbi:MAG TPA: S9 family peptidase [Spirochaetia bacterium]|nr:S9 family peptidase [Spirochaetia bacterium]
MVNKSLFIVIGLFFFVSCSLKTGKESHLQLISLEDFFKNPEKTSFELSPDGEYLAFLSPWKNRLNIMVQKIGESETTRVTSAEERDIAGYFWANSNRLVFLQDQGGDENFRLYAVDRDGKNLKELTPFEKVRVRIIDDLEDNENEMIIGMNHRNKEIFDAYRLNINTGELAMIAENPGNISGWLTDNEGKLRAAVTTDGVNTSILYRKTEKDAFKTILTTNFKETISPLFFTFDNQFVYAVSNIGRDKDSVVIFDIENGKIKETVYENNLVDVSNLLRSKKRKVITGVSFFREKREYVFFDEIRKNLQETLEKKLPGYEVALAGLNKAEDKALIRTYSDKSRGAYYFYDLNQDKLVKLSEISPWLDENQLSDMKPVEYRSRDGLVIKGYLTLPKGMKSENLPVVINPHGGPWARDYWGFDPEVQFLANRGYAVLQMNFRGSTGYGRKFWELGFKQWGKTMQDDITDGVNWLIAQKIADPKRIAIYGGSYGGYAVLAGLAFTPDLYACGVDYVGVSNIFTLLETLPPYWELGRKMMYEMIGDPEKDKELLKAVSPVFHVDKMKAPLFVAQGANDPRVKKSESDQIVEALKKRGIDVPYMVKDNEGHGFHNEENRFDFYREMEKFLSKHLLEQAN